MRCYQIPREIAVGTLRVAVAIPPNVARLGTVVTHDRMLLFSLYFLYQLNINLFGNDGYLDQADSFLGKFSPSAS